MNLKHGTLEEKAVKQKKDNGNGIPRIAWFHATGDKYTQSMAHVGTKGGLLNSAYALALCDWEF